MQQGPVKGDRIAFDAVRESRSWDRQLDRI
jgi:hypothetical protein